jgi:large subunit ribosomal protein L1
MSKAKGFRKRREARALVDSAKRYQLDEAIELLKKCHTMKFDQSVDIAVRLGVEPKHADQMVRGAVVLPHGTGKSVRVLVFAKGDKVAEARDAGADHVGGDDLVEKIKGGWLEFDKVCATPDMMGAVGKIGRVLGPRGMMPNPRTGTVTFDVGKAVEALKGGKIDFRVEKAGILHAQIGRISFDNDKLAENFTTLMEQIVRLKPASAKGTYLRSVTLSGTMTPGIRLETNSLLRTLA